MALTRAQIQTAFQNSLGRPASASDENSYFSVSQSGALTDAQVFSTISNSREADLNADPVVRFYQAAFGRVPDQAGLDNATDYVRAFGASAATYQNLSNMFAQSQEFTNRFGTGTAVDAAYVQALYSTILGRTASSAEVDGYVSGAAGYTTRGGVLYAVSQSQEAISVSDAAVNGFLFNAAEGDAVYSGTLYTAANGQSNAPGTNGQTIVLTTAVDSVVGGTGNDTFNGTLTGNNNDFPFQTASGTFNTGDSITGGTGADTLNIIASNSSQTIVPGTISGVETIRVQSFDSNTIIDLSNATGVQTLAATSGTSTGGAVEFQNVANLVNAQVSGNSSLQIDYNASVVAGTNDVQTLTVDNAFATFRTNGIETISITATGTDNLQLVQEANFKTINVSGAGNLTLNGSITGDATFNGSASTGNLTATFGAGASTVTGGSGNDKFFFGGELAAGDTVAGGAGTDTVSINAQTLTTGETLTALNTRVTGVEVLEFRSNDDGLGATITGGTAAGAFTNSEITKILFNTDGNDIVNSAGSARTYAAGIDNAGDLTLNLGTNVTTVNVALETGFGTTADATNGNNDTANIGTLAVNLNTGAVAGTTETINVASNGAGTGDNVITTVTAVAGSTINVTGSHDLAIEGLTNGGTVNGSAFTGKLTVVGSTVNDAISVGSGGSVVTGGTGGDQITFGSGVDQANFAANDSGLFTDAVPGTGTPATGGTARTITNLDTITSFTAGSGGDHLNITTAEAVNTFTALSATDRTAIDNTTTNTSLSAAIDAAAAAHTANGWTAFTYSGSTYALHEATGASTTYNATDNVVKLVGVDVTTLVQANFGAVTTVNT